jgi:hypothetical protein
MHVFTVPRSMAMSAAAPENIPMPRALKQYRFHSTEPE